ncbi:hypothetical protein [Lactococcus ileimucosae]|nr:hypothetical protein [Lactococcus ileimucosae]
MRKNNKYGGDFKIQVAQDYLSGKYSSTKEVTQAFCVTNKSQVVI